jgi:hypothetical protein
MLTQPERCVARACQDARNPPGVNVFHAVEVNRVPDCAQNGLTRVINAVVPAVGADMVCLEDIASFGDLVG